MFHQCQTTVQWEVQPPAQCNREQGSPLEVTYMGQQDHDVHCIFYRRRMHSWPIEARWTSWSLFVEAAQYLGCI
jgi:hypothetical protein